MLAYDKSVLRARLGKLPEKRRAIFAASCAERLCPFYELYCSKTGRGGPERIRRALDVVWAGICEQQVAEDSLRELAQNCESLLPDEDNFWHDSSPYASNAAAAVIYALETPLSENPERAEWAAFQGFEAAWYYVDQRDDVDPNDRDALAKLHRSQEVQEELARLEADLSELERETTVGDSELAERLRTRAQENPPCYLEQLRRSS